MEPWAILLILLVLGILAGLILLVIAWRRSPPPDAADPRVARATAIGMSVGMLLGGILGTIVWISTEEFVFWIVFLGGGMSVGMAIGHASASRPA